MPIGTQLVRRSCLEWDAAGELIRRSADAVRQHHDVREAELPPAVIGAEAVALARAVSRFEGGNSGGFRPRRDAVADLQSSAGGQARCVVGRASGDSCATMAWRRRST